MLGKNVKVKIKYFAIYEELRAKSEETIILEHPISLRELFFKVMEATPLKEQYFKATLFAVNQSYVPLDTVIQDGDEVAFIPPVSGG